MIWYRWLANLINPPMSAGDNKPCPRSLIALRVTIDRLGMGEDPKLGNNMGADIDGVMVDGKVRGGWKAGRNFGSKGAWCYALFFDAEETADRECGEEAPFDRTHGCSRGYARMLASDEYYIVDRPMPGDAVFQKSKLWTPIKPMFRHVMRAVEEIRADGMLKIIDGNGGRFPCVVQYRLKSPRQQKRFVYLRRRAKPAEV